MLLLLKPWCNPGTDLKHKEECWKSAYDRFKVSTLDRVVDIIENFQFFYTCLSTAQAARDVEDVDAINQAEVSAQKEGHCYGMAD